MTTGQRIALKRKEHGLSQESLGEKLGVSRQSIYKWESDSALPEIDKLVALSRLFGVTVGWLLGVEESAPEAAPAAEELTERQLNMVEEIVSRYTAQLAPPPRRRRWMKAGVLLATFCLLGALWSLSQKLDQLSSRYTNLQNQISHIDSNVNSQINSITGRVEEVLKSQNHLTADYSAELTALDPARGTATFAPRAVPRTYIAGMTACFQADSGDGPAEFSAELGPGGVFSAEITVPLTDHITIAVVFVSPDGTRETQLLDTWTSLYSGTLPDLNVDDVLMAAEYRDGQADMSHQWAMLRIDEDNPEAAAIEELRVGLFVDRKLVTWLTEGERPNETWQEDRRYFYPPAGLQVPLNEGEALQFAAVVTDEYGRTTVYESLPVSPENGDSVVYQSWDRFPDLEDWTY